MSFSAMSRRTTGESTIPSADGAADPGGADGADCAVAGGSSTGGDAAAAAGAGALTAGGGSGSADSPGAEDRTEASDSPGVGGGAGPADSPGAEDGVGGAFTGSASGAAPIRARTCPTSTRSSVAARISDTTPAIGDGTSVSTLSVDTSNRASSTSTVSPTFLNQRVIVPSVTVSPNWGMVTSAIGAPQPCSARPVSDSTVSPKSSLMVGWGWIRLATSSTVASQLTAR